MNCFARINRHLCGPSFRLCLTIKRTPEEMTCYYVLCYRMPLWPLRTTNPPSPFYKSVQLSKRQNKLLRWSVKMMVVSPRFSFSFFTHLGFRPAGVTRSMWLAFLTACAASRIRNRQSMLNHQPARAVRLPTCCESYRTTQPGLAQYLTLTLSRGDVRRQIVCHSADRVSQTWH